MMVAIVDADQGARAPRIAPTHGADEAWGCIGPLAIFGTFLHPAAWGTMTHEPVVLFPGMMKAVRLARVYGFLVERHDGLYHPGGSQRACSIGMAQKMVEGGWLVKRGWRYQPTERGLQAAE